MPTTPAGALNCIVAQAQPRKGSSSESHSIPTATWRKNEDSIGTSLSHLRLLRHARRHKPRVRLRLPTRFVLAVNPCAAAALPCCFQPWGQPALPIHPTRVQTEALRGRSCYECHRGRCARPARRRSTATVVRRLLVVGTEIIP